MLGKTCVWKTSAFAHIGTVGGGDPGGALSQSWIHLLGSVLLFIPCIQRDATPAFQLSHQSGMNSTQHICIKGDTGMTTTFSDDAKESYFLTRTPVIHYLL